jgi:hypothetical protein
MRPLLGMTSPSLGAHQPPSFHVISQTRLRTSASAAVSYPSNVRFLTLPRCSGRAIALPTLDNEDHFIDRDWFGQNPTRTCYARQFRDGWTLLVKRIDRREPRQQRRSRTLIRLGPERQPARKPLPTVYLRTWAKLDTAPETESAASLHGGARRIPSRDRQAGFDSGPANGRSDAMKIIKLQSVGGSGKTSMQHSQSWLAPCPFCGSSGGSSRQAERSEQNSLRRMCLTTGPEPQAALRRPDDRSRRG